MRLLYGHAAGIYGGTLGCALVAVLLLWQEVARDPLLLWGGYAFVLTAGRLYFLSRYRRAAPTGAALLRWGRYFTGGTALSTPLWCAAPFVLFVPGEAHTNAFVVVLICGMMAGASFSLSVLRPAFDVFVLPVGGVLLARLLFESELGTDHGRTMSGLAALTALYVPLVYFFGRRAESNLVRLLESEWRNRELSETLRLKLGELEHSHRALAEENFARVQTERTLRENEQQLRLFELAISSAATGVVFTDPRQRDNPVVYANPAFARMTGHAPADVIGLSLRELVIGDAQGDAVARLREAIREERDVSLLVQTRRRDGTLFWNAMSVTPLRAEGGAVTRFVVLQDDVTARVEMEATLRQTRDELQAVLDNSPTLIFTKDLDGRMVMVNRRWEQIFHLSAEQVRGRTAHEIFPESFADLMHGADVKVLESGDPAVTEETVPTEHGVATHLVSRFPLRDPRGRIYGLCGMATDITERKREQLLQGMHHSVSRMIAEASGIAELMRSVLPVLCETMAWDWGAVYLANRTSGLLEVCASWSEPPLRDTPFSRFALADENGGPGLGFLARARAAREPVWISNLGRLTDARGAEVAADAGLHTAVAMPIFVDGGVIGVLEFCSFEQRDPDRLFLRIARSIGQQLGQFAKRRDAEEQTRRAEERLELALEGSELALFDWNTVTGDVYLSPRWAEMLGYPVAATHTTIQGLTDVAHPDEHAAIRSAILSAFKGRSNLYSVVHRVRRADGEWMWIESTAKVVERDAEGRAVRMAGTNADVTQRVLAEQELRLTRNELQAIIENSPAMIYTKSADGEILVTNRPELLEGGELSAGHPAARGLHPHDQEVITSQAPLQTEELVIEGGVARTYICSRFPLRDAAGAVCGVCAIATDITERKRMEAALGESEDRFRQFAESVNLGFWIFDEQPRRLIYANPALGRLFGWAPEDLVDFIDARRARVEPEDLAAVDTAYRNWLAIASSERLDLDYRIRLPDGEVRWVHDHVAKLLDESGRAWRVLGISEDVTERKSVSEAISEMNAALAKKAADLAASNEELEAFAYSVSHDLRAPLRHVNGFINLLRDQIGERLDPTSERYLGKIQSASARMSALIDELLALSRTSRIEMNCVPVALSSLVREIVTELAAQHAARDIEWRIGDLPTVSGDRTLLRQALFNLLDNAVKYTGRERAPRIEVATVPEPSGDVVIVVRDNGVGFEMKYAHKLFGVFQRLHRHEEFPGTGIGLAHVGRIIERHRGRVWAESTKGEGASFYLALPHGGLKS